MTSIMSRLESGDIEVAKELFLRERGCQSLCCVYTNKEGQFKCDQTDWLPEQEFKNHCRECQSKIAKLLEGL